MKQEVNLTQDGIRLLVQSTKDKHPDGIVLQMLVLQTEYKESKDKTKIYSIVVSDGYAQIEISIINLPIQLIECHRQPIIRIKDWIGKGLNILIKSSEVLLLDYREEIGQPMQWDDYEKNNYQNPKGSNLLKSRGTKLTINKKPSIIQVKQEQSEHKQTQRMTLKSEVKKPSIQLNNSTQLLSTAIATPINTLFAGMNDLFIVGRVVSKSPIQQFKSGNGHLFNIEIMDTDGASIQGAFFNKACDKFYDQIQVGKVYEFQKGQVKLSRFSTQINKYAITFEEYTTIKENESDIVIKTTALNCAPVAHIYNNIVVNEICDIIAIVKENTQPTQQKLKTGDVKAKRVYGLFDKTGYIELTLWGALAEKMELKKGQIIAIRGAKVNEFNDQKSLSTIPTTIFMQDETTLKQIDGYQDLVAFSENSENIDFGKMGSQGSIQNKLSDFNTIEQEFKDKQNDDKYKKFNEVRATVIAFNTNNSHYYATCRKCTKKVEKTQDSMVCNNCDLKVSDPLWKYILTVKLLDDTGSMWVTVHDNLAKDLLKCDAQKYVEMAADKRNDLFVQSSYGENRYLILSKMEEYNGVVRPRHQVIKVIENTFAAETQENLETLNQYL